MSIVEEHVAICEYEDGCIYSKYPKELDDLVASNQSVESLDGVLAAHAGLCEKDGKRYYIHHYTTVDLPARERALLQAHHNNSNWLVAVCEVARQSHEHIASQGNSNERSHHHQNSAKRLDNETTSIIMSDWTTEGSSGPQVKYTSIRIGVAKAKEGTSEEVLDEFVKEFRSLPARFPLLGQISVGRTDSAEHLGPQHYPSSALVDWDLGFALSYASAHDRRELDSDPEFGAIHKKWRSVLGDNHQTWDLDVQSAAA